MDGNFERIAYAPTAVGSGANVDGGLGGAGGIWPLLLLLLLRGRDGLGGGDGCARDAAILAAISNGKDATVAEGRNLADAICSVKEQSASQAFALSTLASQNTQSIKDQNTAFAAIVDRRFDDIQTQITSGNAVILAKLNQTEIDNLRDQLDRERRRGDSREVEISINNTNQQMQAQFQAQNVALDHKLSLLVDQVNSTKQGIINLGTMVASGTQSTAATNIGK